MRSYLSDRTQTVFFNGSFSEVKTVKYGVPQGICLGPLLYTIFTNDLPHVLKKTSISMYADDSTIYTSGATASELNVILNSELRSVVEWINKNKLVLNVSKTNSIIIGSNYAISKMPGLNICINNVVVEQVQETKLL